MQTALDKQFDQAVHHHRSGQLAQAKLIYERVLSQQPGHADSLNYLGILLCQMGQPAQGSKMIARAIRIKPHVALYHNNLGTALKSIGKIDQAILAYREAVRLDPDDPLANCNLGNALREHGSPHEAADACRRALQLKPDYAEAFNNLGNALKDQGLMSDAVAAFQRAAELLPNGREIQNNLGNALIHLGRFKEAVATCRRAIQINPSFTEAFINLGIALNKQGEFEQATIALQRAIELSPNSPQANNNLGIALSNRGMLDEAIIVCRKAVELQPDSAAAHNRLANALIDEGEFDEAIASYRAALKLSPEYNLAHHNLILAMNYHPAMNPLEVLLESQRWNDQHAEPLRQFIPAHTNQPNPDRVLRIGYVSADLREHPVGRFLLPALELRNRSQFQVFCYSQNNTSDQMTEKLRAHTDGWRDIHGMPDDKATELIRNDSIDILIDLSGHTPGNRLLLFARKPAPIQITYLGYPATTGLTTMNYRLTDTLVDPPGLSDSFCTEQLIRLPNSMWCFRPGEGMPDVTDLPATKIGKITFGNFNTIFKLNDPLLISWAKVLNAVPNSRLLLKATGFDYPSVQQKIWRVMSDAGVTSDRIELRARVSLAEHLQMYSEIDIALDSYPYHGTTTTCEALYMGVPVVTLAGDSHVSRVGVSLLSNVELVNLMANDELEYVEIASNLARDVPKLIEMRRTLRTRMQKSPLMNEPFFAANLESAYRSVWRKWCETAP